MSNKRKLTLKSCAVRGPKGMSAYEAAVAEGYEGTAAEYNAIVASLPATLTRLNAYNGRVDAILEYMGNQISVLESKRFVPEGGTSDQLISLQGNNLLWRNEKQQVFVVFGSEVESDEQNFDINCDTTLAQINSAISSYHTLPVFFLKRSDDSIRVLTLVNKDDDEVDFWSDKISGVTSQSILVQVTADGATGTKY